MSWVRVPSSLKGEVAQLAERRIKKCLEFARLTATARRPVLKTVGTAMSRMGVDTSGVRGVK